MCLEHIINSLELRSGNNAIDCTLGDGGHAEAILERIGPDGRLLGIDADAEAILRCKRFLYRFEDRVVFARENFKQLKKIATENEFVPAQAILLDLGWSTPQFKERGRGFSFAEESLGEPLDMRYDTQGNQLTAKEILNDYSAEDLRKIFKNFGEEKFSAEIAQEIVEAVKNKPLEKVEDLVKIVLAVFRKKLKSDKEIPWIGGLHPATKVFQALRIAVNKELEVIKEVLPQAVEILSPGGRLAVITFHSLEDRIVKHYFQSIENKQIKIITKKPLTASEEEVKNNPASRSAKVRVVERIST